MQRTRSIFLILSVFLTFSCEEKDCCVNSQLEISGRFEHELLDCDNLDNPEINCTEWLQFINDSEVDVLYGGTDIIQRFTYTRGADFISLEGPATSSFRPVFIVRDQSTLERKDNGDIWSKK